MSSEEPTDDDAGVDGPEIEVETEDAEADPESAGASPRERLRAEADRAVDGFDQGVIDLLSWLLDTETRARIYVYLRQDPGATSDEVAEGTGLYPSTVREALAELHEEGVVEREKRENAGAGNNPYEYTAIAPSDLVGGLVGQIQDQLNTIFTMDRQLNGDGDGETEGDGEPGDAPITIRVREEDEEDEE